MVPPFSPAEHCLSAPKGRLSANGRQVAGTGGKVADFGGKAAIVLADREPRWPAGSIHPQVATAHSGIRNESTSTNWSGYAADSGTYTSVSATWVEPKGTCSGRSDEYSSFWVGLDGYSSDSVEQDGTIIECYYGSVYQFSWWEMYPTNAIQTVGSTVAAGDSITASVVRSGDSYTLAVTDSTHTANSFSTTQSCSDCANSSAEWIAEAPSGSGGVYPLTDFGTWSASSATVTEGSTAGVISSFTDDEITMVGSSDVKAQPGALNGSGNGFSVTWEHSS